MKTTVKIPELHYTTVEVETSENREDILAAAVLAMEDGQEIACEYSHTLPEIDWIIE